jgi:hypothetical protein
MRSIPSKFAGQSYGSPEGCAEILGIDRSTFYRHVMPHVYSGAIASLKVGACRRIRIDSLLAWAERQEQLAAA